MEVVRRVKLKSLCLGVGLSAALIGAGAVAMAQQYTPPPRTSMGAGAAQGTPVSPRTLAKFKRAYWSVKSIEKHYSAKLQQTRSNKLAMMLRQRAQQKMMSAVKSAGLTIPQYDHVMMLVRREPALRKQVFGH